ncbi:hypothetical protein [Pseudomonas sp. MWU13-2105]|uniref:hypothetical protein n=1 Tax=Pseudomonas sp. MWU13-2105 TaxID=2935074 RepID=UPI00200E4102|nr:hypothetical protein [Pseudomonas sp. MWU13-2105]
MKRNLSLSKKRQIARTVLEGLHGFQHRWPERTKVNEALDSIAKSDDAILVMLRGAAGAGISSILEEFSLKFYDEVIVVTPRIYSTRLNIIGQVLHALFPFSSFPTYKHVPESLIQCRQAARKTIIFDDLDIISSQNNMEEVIFGQLYQLARSRGRYKIIMSTRNRRLLEYYSKVMGVTSMVIPVSGVIPAFDVSTVVQGFYDWCNQQYGTDVQSPCMSRFSKLDQDMPIDRIIYACETLYCSELLKTHLRFNGKTINFTDAPFTYEFPDHFSDLRHKVEHKAFS